MLGVVTLRRDSVHLDTDTVRITGAGALVIPARVTRVGVFVYTNPDGSERREARLPDEVFSRDSLDSLEAAPLTWEHPETLVSPETWKTVSVGAIDDPEVDGSFVRADVVVNDAKTIAAIKAKAIRELSCGYTADFEPTPGEYLGERYDGIQRNIRYNHVALTEQGRAGPDVRLLIDTKGKTNMSTSEGGATPEAPKDAPPPAQPQGMTLEQAMAEIEALKAKLAKYETAAAAAADSNQGVIDSLRAEIAAMPERIRREDAVRAKAARLGVKHDGKPTGDVMREALKARGIGVTGKSDAYVAGAFDSLAEPGELAFPPDVRGDAAPKAPVAASRQARAKFLTDSANAWRGKADK